MMHPLRSLATVLVVVSALAAARCGASVEEEQDDGSTATLAEAIEAINAASAEQGLEPLTVEQFLRWMDVAKYFAVPRADRSAVAAALAAGNMPASYGFSVESGEVRVQPLDIGIVTADGFLPYEDYQAGLLGEANMDLATEPFAGDMPPMTTVDLDGSVQTRVTEIEISGTSMVPGGEVRDGLRIELLLSPGNLDAAADYFGTGFGRNVVRARMVEALGAETSLWVDLEDLLPNWVGARVSTFPTMDDIAVCHGAAREFYYPAQDPRRNASTEATILLLHQWYCRVPPDVHPRFGDYLYMNGWHSGRYIMKDRDTGRDISFSVYSGGFVPYRFWWVDEDFSFYPFAHEPDATVFETKLDVWRRCR